MQVSVGGFLGSPDNVPLLQGFVAGLGFHKGKNPPGSLGNIFPEHNQGNVGTGQKENK